MNRASGTYKIITNGLTFVASKSQKEESGAEKVLEGITQKTFQIWQEIWPIESRSGVNVKEDKSKEMHAKIYQNKTSEN